MNQILSVESNKKEKRKGNYNGPADIQNVLKFFAISLLIFGVFLIGTASYSMYKEASGEATPTKPELHIEEISDKQLLLKVIHNKGLAKLRYSWNDEEPIEIECNGRRNFEQTIDIPSGTSTLNIYVVDVNGIELDNPNAYTIESKTNISFEAEGNELLITANSSEELSYMTYRWDDEEETKVDIQSTQIEHSVEIPKGLHKITVILVDINNHTETKEQEVKGVTKPKLDVTTDGVENFIIRASDEEGLKKLVFMINGTDKYKIELEGRKELEYSYPLRDGENIIEVVVLNQSDIQETFKAKVNK